MKERVWQVSAEIKRQDLNGHGEAARTALYKAQCNCAYWHGVFGGLYSHHLRSAIFENLIQAEKLLAESSMSRVSRYEEESFNSGNRWRVSQENLTSFFNPARGAAMEEVDWLPASLNLMCNLRRRPEPYHEILSESPFRFFRKEAPLSIHRFLGIKDKNMSRTLVYDTDCKLSFMDHFFSGEVSLEEFKGMSYREAGDFVGAPYEASAADGLVFQRQGMVTTDTVSGSIHLKKEIVAQGAQGLTVRYTLENMSENSLQFVFGTEFNFSIYDASVSTGLSEEATSKKIFQDAWSGVQIELSAAQAMHSLCVPIETISESESGMEKTHQGLSILFQKKIDLAPAQKWRQDIGFAVK